MNRRTEKSFIVAAVSVLVFGQAGQAQTNLPTGRPITLQECFSQALSNNLDLQIERINPELALFDLRAAQAGYEPVVKFSGQRGYSATGAKLDSQNRLVPPAETDSTEFSSSLSGVGPMGMSYNLGGTAGEQYGNKPGFSDNGIFGWNTFNSSSGNLGVNLTQPLLKNFIIDDVRYGIKLARNQTKYSEVQLRGKVISVMTAVELAYFDLMFARESVRVQDEGVRLAQRLYDETRKRVAIGTLARLDEKQSESQVAARESDLSVALQSLETAQNVLKRLITANYRTLYEASFVPSETLTAVPQVLNVQESWRTGLEQRPDLQQARLDLEKQGITVKYLKNRTLPELDLVGSYGHNASSIRNYGGTFDEFVNGHEPAWTAGAAITFPLSNKAAREKYRQGKRTADQMLLELKKLEETAVVEIAEVISRIKTNLKLVRSTREARLYAEQALDAEQKKLDSGKSTSFVVLQLQRDLTSARSEEIKALADYNKSVASLHQVEGTTLEWRKISMESK